MMNGLRLRMSFLFVLDGDLLIWTDTLLGILPRPRHHEIPITLSHPDILSSLIVH